jgi:reactive intermediate/imine deaminase
MKIERTAWIILVVTLAVVALANQEDATPRRIVNLPRGATSNLPFSDAVLVGNTLYMSGWIGFTPGTTTVPPDPKEEAKNLLDRYQAILNEAGMSMENLVWVTVYCPDVSLFGSFNEVYRTYLQRDFPARAFIGSGPLLFGGRFEMQGIAVK